MSSPEWLQLAAMRACEQAVIEFSCLFDEGRYAEMQELFAPDGIWHRTEGDILGSAGLARFLASRDPRILARHVLSNLRVTLHTQAQATVDCYVTAWRCNFPGEPTLPAPLGTPFIIGRYRDALVLDGNRWKIRERHLHVDFKAA